MSNCKWTCLSIYLLHPHRSMFAYTVTAALKSKTVHACTPVFTCYSSKPAANSALHPPPHKISRAPPAVKAIQVYVYTDIHTHANLDFFNSVIYITYIHVHTKLSSDMNSDMYITCMHTRIHVHTCLPRTFLSFWFLHHIHMHTYILWLCILCWLNLSAKCFIYCLVMSLKNTLCMYENMHA